MIISKKNIAGALGIVKNVVPKDGNIEALQGVLIDRGYLIASNSEMSIKLKLDTTEEETFILPKRAFDLINNLPNTDVDISCKNNTVTIRADRIRNNVKTLDATLYPLPKEKSTESTVTIPGELLSKSLKRVSYAIKTSGIDAMSGMCIKAVNGTLNFVGLDGHTLAWDKHEYDGDFEMVVPKNVIDKLKNMSFPEDVTIKYAQNVAVFEDGQKQIITRLINKAYYPYERMFNPCSMQTSVSRTELLDALVRANMCTDRTAIRIDIEKDVLTVSVNESAGDYREVVGLHEEVDSELSISFDAKLLIETLKSFDADVLQFELQSNKHPLIISTEDGTAKSLVLPVVTKTN